MRTGSTPERSPEKCCVLSATFGSRKRRRQGCGSPLGGGACILESRYPMPINCGMPQYQSLGSRG
jgi:hypothetical protein